MAEGFLDAQLAQGYAINYSQRAGLLSSEDKKAYNDILNGMEAADRLLSFGLETRDTRINRTARPGEYKVDTAKEIRTRIAMYQRSAGNFEIKLYFRADRVMSREQRYKRDNHITDNRKIPKGELDRWEIRNAPDRFARRAIIRRIIGREIIEEIVKNIVSMWWRRPDLEKLRDAHRLAIFKRSNQFRKLAGAWRGLSRAVRESRAIRLFRNFKFK